MLQRQEGAVGTLQGTNALLIVRTMFVPPVRCCFSKTSFISKSKRSVNQRQDSDACTWHPQQIKLTPSSRNALFFALLPFRSSLLAVRRGQLQPDKSTSQMEASPCCWNLYKPLLLPTCREGKLSLTRTPDKQFTWRNSIPAYNCPPQSHCQLSKLKICSCPWSPPCCTKSATQCPWLLVKSKYIIAST